ncbi:unnamed protein product [Ectocarpus sp. CCAP 1310/34]|nr:unnamed protein product [Ectocarpus sp. CCAP 1310/34]
MDDILQRWARLFSTLLNTKSPTLNPDIIERVTQRPATRDTKRLGEAPELEEVERATKGFKNWKAPGVEMLPAELLKIDDDEPFVLGHIHPILVKVWNGGDIPQKRKDATIKLLYKKGDRSNWNKYKGISLLSHVGKVPIKITTNRLSTFCEANNILSEKQCGFRPGRSTVDMLFVVRRLQALGLRKKIPLYMFFVDLKKAYDSVDREMLWKVLVRAGIPVKLIKVIRRFHDGMRARVRTDDGELSDWFFVTQGVRHVYFPHCCSTCSSPKFFEVVVIRFFEDDVGKSEARGGRRHPLTEYGGQYGGCCMPMVPASYRGPQKDWRE